jgi:integrase
MRTKEYLLIPLFEKFIRYSLNGKRLHADGKRINKETVSNYNFVLGYLVDFQKGLTAALRIKIFNSTNKRLYFQESNYWKNFYRNFTDYLYDTREFYDNYVGMIMKIIRAVFNFVNVELGIPTGLFYKRYLFVSHENIPVISLMPEQLEFLIKDKDFELGLSRSLAKSKDIFVFGCTVGLRRSDLFALRATALHTIRDCHYLEIFTKKTDTEVRIKLPAYAVAIFEKFKSKMKRRSTVFPPIPPSRFNDQLRAIAELAGWIEPVERRRARRGIKFNIGIHGQTRFCDLVSSHIMRKTAITVMLMLGMKERVVRKISGHTFNSQSFDRYVNFAQSFIDNEMDVVFNQLAD